MTKRDRSSPAFRRTSKRFGARLRVARERLARDDPGRYTILAVANRIGMQPSFLSRIERAVEPPPSTKIIMALAAELKFNPDVLLAEAERLSPTIQELVCRRPLAMMTLLRNFDALSDRQLFAAMCRDLAEAGVEPAVPIPDAVGVVVSPREADRLEKQGILTLGAERYPEAVAEVEGQGAVPVQRIACGRCGTINCTPPPHGDAGYGTGAAFSCKYCGQINRLPEVGIMPSS